MADAPQERVMVPVLAEPGEKTLIAVTNDVAATTSDSLRRCNTILSSLILLLNCRAALLPATGGRSQRLYATHIR